MTRKAMLQTKFKFLNPVAFTFLLAVAISILPKIQAATIAQIGSKELVNNSELIFDGVVLSVVSEMAANGFIYTYVEFRLDEVIVGNYVSGDVISLRFAGGEVGTTSLDLGVVVPDLNERGIYFVERVAPGLINPLLGWSQGHFVVAENGLIYTESHQPIFGVTQVTRSQQIQISNGIANGIETQTISSPSALPIDVEEFKERILDLLN